MQVATKAKSETSRWKHCLSALLLSVALSHSGVARGDGFGASSMLLSLHANQTTVPGAFQNPVSLEASFGFKISSLIYFGFVGDYWLATRQDVGSSSTLNYLSGGAELGFYKPSYRWFWFAAAGAFYPLVFGGSSTTGDEFTALITPISYRARAMMGLRVSQKVAFTLGGGFRWMPLGVLTGASGPFAGGSLDLSGMFFSLGLSFTL